MSIARKKMIEALVDWVVPFLKAKGFKGLFPHYHRIKENQTDLLMFQFTNFDAAFCVNLAKCPAQGIQLSNGSVIPPELAEAMYCRQKLILGSESEGSYHWFKYNPKAVELRDKDKYPFMTMYPESLLKYKQIATDIIKLLEAQGEKWWGETLKLDVKETVALNNLFIGSSKYLGNYCKSTFM